MYPFNVCISNTRNSAIATRALSYSTKMVKAIRIYEPGGPEVLKWEDVKIGEPKEGEVKVKNKAIGINFRKGVYKADTNPFIPGMEAVGEVIAVGQGLTGGNIGDIVAYAGNPKMGAYTEEQIFPVEKHVPVPTSIDPVTTPSIVYNGLTCQLLLRSCFKVKPGHAVLVHAAAVSGVGSLFCQWANALGAIVIGTVSTMEKAKRSKFPIKLNLLLFSNILYLEHGLQVD